MYEQEISQIQSSLFIKAKIKPILIWILKENKDDHRVQNILQLLEEVQKNEQKFYQELESLQKTTMHKMQKFMQQLPTKLELMKQVESQEQALWENVETVLDKI